MTRRYAYRYCNYSCDKFHLSILQSKLICDICRYNHLKLFARFKSWKVSETFYLSFSKGTRNLTDVRQTFCDSESVDNVTSSNRCCLVPCNAFVKLQSDRSRICRTLCTVKERMKEKRESAGWFNKFAGFISSFVLSFSPLDSVQWRGFPSSRRRRQGKAIKRKSVFECVLPRCVTDARRSETVSFPAQRIF